MAADVTVTFDADLGGNAVSKLDEIKKQLTALTEKTHTIKVDIDGNNAIKTLNDLLSGKNGGTKYKIANTGKALGQIKDNASAAAKPLNNVAKAVENVGKAQSKALSKSDTNKYINSVKNYVKDLDSAFKKIETLNTKGKLAKFTDPKDLKAVQDAIKYTSENLKAAEQMLSKSKLGQVTTAKTAQRYANDAAKHWEQLMPALKIAEKFGALKLKKGFGDMPAFPKATAANAKETAGALADVATQAEKAQAQLNKGLTVKTPGKSSLSQYFKGIRADVAQTVAALKEIGAALDQIKLKNFNLNFALPNTGREQTGRYVENVRDYVRGLKQARDLINQAAGNKEISKALGTNNRGQLLDFMRQGAEIDKAVASFEKRLNSVKTMAGAERVAKDAMQYWNTLTPMLDTIQKTGLFDMGGKKFGAFPTIHAVDTSGMAMLTQILSGMNIQVDHAQIQSGQIASNLDRTTESAKTAGAAVKEVASATKTAAKESEKAAAAQKKTAAGTKNGKKMVRTITSIDNPEFVRAIDSMEKAADKTEAAEKKLTERTTKKIRPQITGAIKQRTAELQTQKKLLSEMMSTATGARRAIKNSPILGATQKAEELGRLKLFMDDLHRAMNSPGFNSTKTMRTLDAQAEKVRKFVSSLKEQEKATKAAAAADKKYWKDYAAGRKQWEGQLKKIGASTTGKTAAGQATDTKSMLSDLRAMERNLLTKPLADSGKQSGALGYLKSLREEMERFPKASSAMASNMRDRLGNISKMIDGYRKAEVAAKKAAEADKKRAAAAEKATSNALVNKQKSINKQLESANKNLLDYQKRYQTLREGAFGDDKSVAGLKSQLAFAQSLYDAAKNATPTSVGGNLALKSLIGSLSELETAYSRVEARAKSYNTAQKDVSNRWQAAETAKQKNMLKQVDTAMGKISKYDERYQKLLNSPFGDNKAVTDFGGRIARVAQFAESLKNLSPYDPKGAKWLTALSNSVEALGKSYASVKGKADAFAASQRAAAKAANSYARQSTTMQNQMQAFLEKNPRLAGTSYSAAIQDMVNEMQGKVASGYKPKNVVADLQAYRKQFEGIKTAAADAGKVGATFGQSIIGAVKKFGGWMMVTHSVMKVIQTIKDMIGTVRDLDTAMVEMKRVTNETQDTYDKFYQGARKRAVDIGATLTDTIQASADFVKLGYSIEDSPQLADAALVYKNVGIGIEDISEASGSIISAMKAFGLSADDAMSVVDKFNLVGNNFAISSAGIGDAIERSASAMASAGNTLDETIALITAGNEVVNKCATCA